MEMTSTIETAGKPAARSNVRIAVVAWLLVSIYYFYQYSLRSAPAVMVPQLSEAFGVSAFGVASIVGLFYYGYSPFSLVAGAGMDRLGPRKLIPFAAIAVGIGALLFATGNPAVASVGRFIQGAGGVFALVGAIYIASKNFPANQAATLIGATQMFGMAGGSAGQFVVGPLIAGGLAWYTFWNGMGVIALVIGVILFILLPSQEKKSTEGDSGMKPVIAGFKRVFSNPQSIYCGLIAGLLFVPTTIFDMVWGVRFLQDSFGFGYAESVLRSATVPFGWIIGCPLMGFISDKIGRRKPVIMGGALVLGLCLLWILFGIPGVFPPYVLGVIAGIASGAAMIPYTVIKEANRPEHSGTATGVINFINFSLTALFGPLFAARLMRISEGAAERELADYQATFMPMLIGVALAIGLTLLLRETGPKARRTSESSLRGAELPAE